MNWPFMLLKVFNIAAAIAYYLLFLLGGLRLVEGVAFLILYGFARVHPVTVLTHFLIAAAVLVAFMLLGVAHWRAGAQPSRRLTIFSACLAGLLAVGTVAMLVLPVEAMPWLDGGDPRSAALVTGLLVLPYAAYAFLSWELERKPPPAAG